MGRGVVFIWLGGAKRAVLTGVLHVTIIGASSNPISLKIHSIMVRPVVEIPASPQPPFPLIEKGPVVSGFGRGSSELGIPTANVPIESLSLAFRQLDTGVYFGFCKLTKDKGQSTKNIVNEATQREVEYTYGLQLKQEEEGEVFPHVMSIGWNPFYSNKEKTAEIHIMHKFGSDFYGAQMTFSILGYIRPELDYTTKDALIEDINIDIQTALKTLELQGYKKYRNDLAEE